MWHKINLNVSCDANRQGLEKMEREKQKTAEKKQPKESLEFNQRRVDEKYDKLSPKQFSKFVSVNSKK